MPYNTPYRLIDSPQGLLLQEVFLVHHLRLHYVCGFVDVCEWHPNNNHKSRLIILKINPLRQLAPTNTHKDRTGTVGPAASAVVDYDLVYAG